MAATAGGEHSLYEKNGSLYSTGACGLGWCRLHSMTFDLFHFRPVPLVEPISLVHASYYHNLAVGAKTGTLYSWGCGTFPEGGMDGVIPALGQGSNAQDVGGLPKAVVVTDNKDKIIDITGGVYHSALLTKSGKILTFGAGQLGQLGRQLTHNTDASGLPVDPSPREAPHDHNVEMRKLGGAFYNTFAICKSNNLYCTGENQNKQCGEGPRNLQRLTLVKEVANVDQVEGGYCHTLIKTIAGKVYSMGCGDDGQRGDGDPDAEAGRAVVTPVEIPVPVTQVAAGANHSVVLGKNGVAYVFGANDVGQCGVPSETHKDDEEDDDEGGGPVLSPTPVRIPNSAGKVTKVSAGYAHTVLTTESGKVFVFGQNDNGQLGVGGESFKKGEDPEAQTTPIETPLPQT